MSDGNRDADEISCPGCGVVRSAHRRGCAVLLFVVQQTREIVAERDQLRAQLAQAEVVIDDIRRIAQECRDDEYGDMTPGGVEHTGDFRNLILRWEKALADLPDAPKEKS